MIISKKLLPLLIVFLLFNVLEYSSSAANIQTTTENDISDYNGYIIKFYEDPISVFKNQIKENIKNVLSPDVTITEKIQIYKEKLLSLHSQAKNDILNLIGNTFASQKVFSWSFTNLFNGIKIEDVSNEIVEKIRNLAYVKSVIPDYKISVNTDVSIPLINASEVWNYHDETGKSLTGEGVSIAVIDSGVDYNHPDFQGRYVKGYDFVNNDKDPMDDCGHGTHCAGIALGSGKASGYQYVGVAPEAELYAYKVLDESGNGYGSYLIAAMEQAVDDGVDIISLSLGDNTDSANPDDPLSETADNAVNEGVIVVVAAGNNGTSGPINSPGCARKTICVGASDDYDTIASFSSRGPVVWGEEIIIKPDIVAPGVSIRSNAMGYGYTTMSGTSMATPHIAGVAALILQAHPDFTPEDVKKSLNETAVDIGYDENSQGNGRVDVFSAVNISWNFLIKSPYRVNEKELFTVNVIENGSAITSCVLFLAPFHLPRLKRGRSITLRAFRIFSPLQEILKGKLIVFSVQKKFIKIIEIQVSKDKLLVAH